MPDGYAGSYLPALSRLLGEVEQPTQTNQMMAPQFGGQPDQLAGILNHPHVQQLMQQFGINFNPQQVRQSPFLPNSFMQHHPQLGGAMSGAMSNMAATPEAPMVSGAGSGISRAMQGMMGGPEMQRQYQVRQMMAPFQAMGMQIPAQEYGRKQDLMSLLQQMEQDRMKQGQASLDERRMSDESRQRISESNQRMQLEKQAAQEPKMGPPGTGVTYPGQPAQPGFQGQPTGAPGLNFGSMMSPGQAAQPGRFEPYSDSVFNRQKQLKGTGPPRAGSGGGRKPSSQKDFASLEDKKHKDYEGLQKQYSPYWGDTPLQGFDKKTWGDERGRKQKEFQQAQQGVEDNYSQQRELMGAPVPPYQYPGQTSNYHPGMMAPVTQQGQQQDQQGQGEDYSDTHELRQGPHGYGWYAKQPQGNGPGR